VCARIVTSLLCAAGPRATKASPPQTVCGSAHWRPPAAIWRAEGRSPLAKLLMQRSLSPAPHAVLPMQLARESRFPPFGLAEVARLRPATLGFLTPAGWLVAAWLPPGTGSRVSPGGRLFEPVWATGERHHWTSYGWWRAAADPSAQLGRPLSLSLSLFLFLAARVAHPFRERPGELRAKSGEPRATRDVIFDRARSRAHLSERRGVGRVRALRNVACWTSCMSASETVCCV